MTQPNGSVIELRQMGDEFYHYWVNHEGIEMIQNADGYWEVAPEQLTLAQRKARRAASPMLQSAEEIRKSATRPSRVLVILVNFKDKSMQSKHNKTFFDHMLNQLDSLSVREYFKQSSDGKYIPQFDVWGPVTTDSVMAYYGGNNANGNDLRVGCMIHEACIKAHDLGCDFSKYDEDGDGKVDNINVIFAGYSESSGGGANCIWPNKWNMKDCRNCGGSYYLDGKRLYSYSCSAELKGSSGTNSAGIGTFCHEFSHILGMPDYYDTNYGYNNDNDMTPGAWSLMDNGNYNNNSQSPPLYSIFDKCYMGWASMPPLLAKDAQVTMTMPVGTEYCRHITGGTTPKKYTSTDTIYYIENRQKTGYFDKGLPYSGMLIWRVLYKSNWEHPNNDSCVLRYTLVSAKGSATGIGTKRDPYPGYNNVTSKTLLPGCVFSQITNSNGNITFNFNGGSTTYTHTWKANGSTFATTTSHSSLTLPASQPSPWSGVEFAGWTTQEVMLKDGSNLTLAEAYDEISANTTFYAVYKSTSTPTRYFYEHNAATHATLANAQFVIVEGQSVEIGSQMVTNPGVYSYDTIKTIYGDSLLAVNLTWADLDKTIVYTAPAQLTEVTGTSKTYGLHTDKFGQPIMEHYFSNGIGVVAFNNDLTTIGDYAFFGSRKGLNNSVTGIQLPSTVTTIGAHAFDNCWELASINLPEGVTSVGDNAFYKCTSLTNLRSEALTPPTCGSNCFQYATTKIILYVWPSAKVKYVKTNGWKDLSNIRYIYCGTTPAIHSETDSICEGSSYTWKGKELTKTGVYADTTYTDLYGCDSVITQLTLFIQLIDDDDGKTTPTGNSECRMQNANIQKLIEQGRVVIVRDGVRYYLDGSENAAPNN